jgi:hypothetical protein
MPIRYADVRAKAGALRQLTSLTVDEFDALVPLVQKTFAAHMEAWTLEGKPRNGRRYSQYATCPLPTPEDRLLFVLMYLKGAPLQSAHAAAFGLTQPKANLWLRVLLTALRTALASGGKAPTRTAVALQERLEALTRPPAAAPDAGAAGVAPLLTMARNAPSRAPRTQVIRPTTLR